MLTLDALRDAVVRDDVDTVVVGFTDHYGRLVGKRYDAGMFLKSFRISSGFHSFTQSNICCTSSVALVACLTISASTPSLRAVVFWS